MHGNVVAGLGIGVVSGRLAAGQVITLDGIGAEYGVSRGVAREAIRVLESMGLVASRRRVGITIQSREDWHVFDPRVIRWRLEAGD
ncbi:MAG: FadR family transcriptional regulator, partial [Aldersonia sp.]|nr:FadR family transcriptional regulator [Aldersonia sp.]